MINAKLYIGSIRGKLIQRNLLRFKVPVGFPKTVFIKTTHFEDELVNYFIKNQGKQTCQTIKHFNKEDKNFLQKSLQKFLVTTRPHLSAEKFYTKTNMKILHRKF